MKKVKYLFILYIFLFSKNIYAQTNKLHKKWKSTAYFSRQLTPEHPHYFLIHNLLLTEGVVLDSTNTFDINEKHIFTSFESRTPDASLITLRRSETQEVLYTFVIAGSRDFAKFIGGIPVSDWYVLRYACFRLSGFKNGSDILNCIKTLYVINADDYVPVKKQLHELVIHKGISRCYYRIYKDIRKQHNKTDVIKAPKKRTE